MRIDVKQEHIDNGVVTFVGCPLALAIGEALNLHSCSVKFTTARWSDRGKLIHAYLPVNAIDFRERFDRGDKVRPFSFEIDMPES